MWTASISLAAITAGRCSPRRIGRSRAWTTYLIRGESIRLGSVGSSATAAPTTSATVTGKDGFGLPARSYQLCAAHVWAQIQRGIQYRARLWKTLSLVCHAERKPERLAAAFLSVIPLAMSP